MVKLFLLFTVLGSSLPLIVAQSDSAAIGEMPKLDSEIEKQCYYNILCNITEEATPDIKIAWEALLANGIKIEPELLQFSCKALFQCVEETEQDRGTMSEIERLRESLSALVHETNWEEREDMYRKFFEEYGNAVIESRCRREHEICEAGLAAAEQFEYCVLGKKGMTESSTSA
ncbi:uncharacterized protein BO97DRAFT_418141 [Aspergillus homomorphus CBS 101889]|uniref:Uncharacterized protein n=1 Tax=Aspergillus homomorphus (strain CBS 101889) TaxID=1450537 RepID=A0A395HJ16_ASPHC|nr:hypothetical protein BO97DRAFT_418141 [Aspergillus homomorphus CBS 101889]RAL07922.1 hypothetical protein BO97DRAFT_418141 [Aspergillus homomorphus CBS 101889]